MSANANRVDLEQVMELAAQRCEAMLQDPDLKASGLAAVASTLKQIREFRADIDDESEVIRVPRPGSLRGN
jgi:hypothetical protein